MLSIDKAPYKHAFHKPGKRTGGVYTCLCEHGFTYVSFIIKNAEGRNEPFTFSLVFHYVEKKTIQLSMRPYFGPSPHGDSMDGALHDLALIVMEVLSMMTTSGLSLQIGQSIMFMWVISLPDRLWHSC